MNDQIETDGTIQQKYDLQDRFIDYAVRVIKLSENLPETKAGKHICSQILRSGTSPAPNYGEAQGAESKADFIHKLKIALKELRETEVWLKIMVRANIIQPSEKVASLLRETDELISIVFKSIGTAKENNKTVERSDFHP
jgi:four helix bundle protein